MRFFDKFRREEKSEKREEQVYRQKKLSHLQSYHSIQKRALIGWIVSRCVAALKLEELDQDTLFFMSFTALSFDELEEGPVKELIQLADKLVEWIEKNAVIEEEMKSIITTNFSKKALLRVFSEIQADVKLESLKPKQLESTWEVYRDVIYASTHGGFLLITKNEMEKYQQGELLCSCPIENREDVPKARNIAKEVFTSRGVSSSKIMSYNLIISEAVTNILKHAEYGRMDVYYYEDVYHVIVSDKGPGFPLKILPKTTLMAGFSTKESLGQGFTLMMKMSRQVALETSSEGSTLILVLDAEGDGRSSE